MAETLFDLFDPADEIEVSYRRLPHWQQTGKTYFVTFRTDDSVPESIALEWRDSRVRWLADHGIDSFKRSWRESLARLPDEIRREFQSRFTDRFQDILDDCHGECVLRRPELAGIVSKSLLHFDHQRYEMSDFVVMPNHVHLLAQFTTTTMKNQCESWKHYTAVQINRSLGKKGRFWQIDQFDALVRSEMQFEAIKAYIAENPRKAKLRKGEFIHYARNS
jgi:REP element-mobilizing transposase RayT